MIQKRIFPFRKRVQTQITTKTQALKVIKEYQLDQSRINFGKINQFNDKDMLNVLDNDYSQLTPHKKVYLDQVYHISLFTYCQQFYCLQMLNYVFPMRVLIKNVRHDGTLYIGYDQEYPGIYHQNKFSIFELEGESTKNYDYKATINKDMLITLKSKANKLVKYIYFTFIAGSSLLMFDFKVQFLGFGRNNRLNSEAKIKIPINNISKQQLSSRLKTQPLKQQNSKQFQRSKFPQISKINNDKLVKIQQLQVFNQLIGKRHSKSSASNSKLISNKLFFNETQLINKKIDNNKIRQLNHMKINIKSDVDIKLQQIKRNKQIYDIYRLKDKQLRQTANRCKRLIQNYEKVYNEQSIRKRKLNKDISTIIYSLIYVISIYNICQIKIKKDKMKFKVVYLCKKFIRKLKKKYSQSCKMIPYRYKRLICQTINVIKFEGKIIQKYNKSKSSKIFINTIIKLKPLVCLSRSLTLSIQYIEKIKIIQLAWRLKYHNRIKCLIYFIKIHIQKMIKQHTNFILFVEQFYQKGMHLQFCIKYVKDESQKFRFIYDVYLKKLQEYNEIIDINRSISIENSGSKSKLIQSKRPIKPMHRFYRNTDILKSMIRTWFQIQFKKHIKKSSRKLLK